MPVLATLPASLHRENPNQLEDLWFLMNQGHGDNARVLVCYADDSGTEEASQLVVVGGCLFDKDSFFRFQYRWKRLLHRYGLDSLHMTDFVRPQGKHIGMYRELKIALFTEAVKIINTRKTYSISAAVDNPEFKVAVSTEFYRKYLGPYAAAFIGMAQMNSRIAEHNKYPDHIGYLVDEGSQFADQIRLAHLYVRSFEKESGWPVRTGGLTFGDDVDVLPLQAADLVAWTSRRRYSGSGLVNEFSPLNALFEERFDGRGIPVRPHVHVVLPKNIAAEVSRRMRTDPRKIYEDSMKALESITGGHIERVVRPTSLEEFTRSADRLLSVSDEEALLRQTKHKKRPGTSTPKRKMNPSNSGDEGEQNDKKKERRR